MAEGFESFELPLSECELGDEGVITTMDTDAGLAPRLRELGLVPGSRVRVARAGSPLIVEVGNARLCLRSDDASRVLMRLELFPDALASATHPGPALELALERLDRV